MTAMGTEPVARTGPPSGPAVVIGVRGAAILATFALSVVVARLLGPSEAGQFFLLFTLATLIATVGRWGTDVLILKVLSGRLEGSGREARQLLALGLAVSMVVALIAVVAMPVLLSVLVTPTPAPTAVRLAMLCAVPSSLYLGAAAALRGTGRIAAGTFVELGGVPALTVLGLLVLAGSGAVMSVVLSFAVLLGASLLVAAVSVPMALTRVPGEGPSTGSMRHLARQRAATLTSMCGSATLFFALVWAPVLVLGVVSTSDQVAFYTAASRIAAFILLIPAIQSSYLVPRFIELFHTHRLAEMNALSVRSTRQAAALGGAAAVVILLVPSQLLALFGTGFADAVAPLRMLAIGAAVVCMLGQVAPLLLNTGLEHAAALLGVIALLVGVGLMSVAGGAWGAPAVALVAVAVNVSYAGIGSGLLRRRASIVTTVLGRSQP